MIMDIKNLIAATYSPLKEDGSLNLDIIKGYGAFLKSNKVAGAFVNGTTGDFASLTPDERKLIIDKWAKDKPSDLGMSYQRPKESQIRHQKHLKLSNLKEIADRLGSRSLEKYYPL